MNSADLNSSLEPNRSAASLTWAVHLKRISAGGHIEPGDMFAEVRRELSIAIFQRVLFFEQRRC
jgi:hypothetical protein